MAKIAILGYGTVGGGVALVLDENVEEVIKSAGEEVSVKTILDLRTFPGDPHESQVTDDFNTILEDPEISVICETMGGINPAYEFTKQALSAGKSVCTSNKELVATHGPELIMLARKNKVSYLFEASVGGGIPILRTIEGALASERIDEISGILNGTTNYILTKMNEEGAAFEDVLAKAQELGYAEKDPTADIEGHDACRKIAILGGLMTEGYVDPEDVPTEGITKINTDDLAFARAFGGTVRLLGNCRQTDDGLEIMVAPFIVPFENPLASVNGVFNAITVHGNMLGTSMYYGQGAGREATASAVVADVCEIVRNAGKSVPVSMTERRTKLAPRGGAEWRFYLRVDKSRRAEAISRFPGSTEMKGDAAGADPGTAAILTARMKESAFLEKISRIDGIKNWMRMLEK